MRLKDKVSLITGASSGIGKAIALTFAREGSDIIVNYSKSKDKAQEVVNEITKIGRRAIAIRANLGNKDEVFNMVVEAIKSYDKIDILVNNAAIYFKTPDILQASTQDWDNTLAVNLLGTYYCIQAVTPQMINRRYGKIINISSVGGIGDIIKGQVTYAPLEGCCDRVDKETCIRNRVTQY